MNEIYYEYLDLISFLKQDLTWFFSSSINSLTTDPLLDGFKLYDYFYTVSWKELPKILPITSISWARLY